ncbi:MAG: hypothetical protein M3Y55_17060, partial [Pseudomonadota bacterium]|nr:hypothetical protein [Pseudomonadota bacterium]
MRSPLVAWRAGSRWPLAVLTTIALLLIVIGACEAAGWPFLVAPVQSWLAKTLDRRVVFAGNETDRVRIGLIGSVRVTAPSIEIGAPSWSSAPHMLLAHDAHLALGYVDLWRAWRGGSLHVADLEATTLDGALERRADGNASWQFGSAPKTDASDKPTAFPTFGRLRVGDGHVAYDD